MKVSSVTPSRTRGATRSFHRRSLRHQTNDADGDLESARVARPPSATSRGWPPRSPSKFAFLRSLCAPKLMNRIARSVIWGNARLHGVNRADEPRVEFGPEVFGGNRPHTLVSDHVTDPSRAHVKEQYIASAGKTGSWGVTSRSTGLHSRPGFAAVAAAKLVERSRLEVNGVFPARVELLDDGGPPAVPARFVSGRGARTKIEGNRRDGGRIGRAADQRYGRAGALFCATPHTDRAIWSISADVDGVTLPRVTFSWGEHPLPSDTVTGTPVGGREPSVQVLGKRVDDPEGPSAPPAQGTRTAPPWPSITVGTPRVAASLEALDLPGEPC